MKEVFVNAVGAILGLEYPDGSFKPLDPLQMGHDHGGCWCNPCARSLSDNAIYTVHEWDEDTQHLLMCAEAVTGPKWTVRYKQGQHDLASVVMAEGAGEAEAFLKTKVKGAEVYRVDVGDTR